MAPMLGVGTLQLLVIILYQCAVRNLAKLLLSHIHVLVLTVYYLSSFTIAIQSLVLVWVHF